ncbi:MAG: hypothetical protein PVG20_10690 [Thioalkalispiraceae bacterium]|jgi:uncharacterized membrane protein YraQ (UPF0718 family)
MPKKQQPSKKHGVGGWIFLAIVLLIYGLTFSINDQLAVNAMTSFVHMLDKVLPALLIVLGLIFIINLLLAPERVKKYLGKQSGIKGWLTAVIAGVLSTGPVYPWYALLRDLREKGMKTSLAAAFLYSRAIKLPLLPMLIHYFGLTYTLVLTVYLLLFSIITGLAMGKAEKFYHHTD